MNDSIIIRDALTTDHDDIYRLICILENNTPDRVKFNHIFNTNLNSKDIYYKVAVFKCKIIGFISLHIQIHLHHAGYIAEIQELVIATDYRGMGSGKMMLKEAENIARYNNCDFIELATNKKRVRAHKFYETNDYMNTHYKLTKRLNPS